MVDTHRYYCMYSLSPSLGVVGRAVPLLGGEKAGRDDTPYPVRQVNGHGVHLESERAENINSYHDTTVQHD